MSGNKRAFDWLSVTDTSGSDTKRAKFPSGGPNPTLVSDVSSSSADPSQITIPTHVAGHALLTVLKVSMDLVRRGSDAVFPHLASAAEGLLEALEAIDTTTLGNRNLNETASQLPEWATALSAHLSERQPERMSRVLHEQAEYIKTQQQRGKMRRLTESRKDIEELEWCHRRIEAVCSQMQTDASLSAWKNTDEQLKDSRLNGLSPAYDARYDSSFSDKIERGACFQNTRVTVLEGVRRWIYCPSEIKIYWVNGMAGTGKTTIAYTVCAELEKNERLGASFFCSRSSPECRDVSCILPTIAYQLAQRSQPFRSALSRILGEGSDIGRRSVSVQFEHLIKSPLLEVKDVLPRGLVIVIDALDECSDPSTTTMMLKTLLSYAANLPVRFFLTSRPEPSISRSILALDCDGRTRSILELHNVEEELVKSDITTYLTVSLARLSLTEKQIEQLAKRAGILFIYAATVVRYILADLPGVDSFARLETVMAGDTDRTSKKDEEIDRLYNTILEGALGGIKLEKGETERIKQLLWTVVCAREPVTRATLAALLKLDDEKVLVALQPLQSVLHISKGSEVVSTLHSSFPDFLLSSERSGPFYCDRIAHNKYLSTRCFEIMREQLRFNICGLETSYRFDKDVPNLQERVDSAISPELFYACRYWAEHLRHSTACDELLACLEDFLHEQLLFWMEVLNLKGWIGNAPKVLVEAQNCLLKRDIPSEVRKFVRDSRDFVTTFAANPVSDSTPHIYISVLSLVSKQSKVWKTYWRRTRGLFQVEGTIRQWQGGPLATLKLESGVSAIAYSPDGTRFAAGSHEGVMRICDAYSGSLLAKPFRGHRRRVTCISFSPDGTRLISGSWDSTVSVWDAHNGLLLAGPFGLDSHSGSVLSVAFSRVDERIIVVCKYRTVSGCTHDSIRVRSLQCETSTTSLVEFCIPSIFSAAFSPKRSLVASGCGDCSIRVWDAHNGALLLGPLKGHTDVVDSVAFSQDGTQIASGSHDCTIRVWSSYDGTLIAGPFGIERPGYTNQITRVAFSPDGTHIASASRNYMIRVWDVQTSAILVGPLAGHTEWVEAIAFSPDGSQISSVSLDGVIHLWDIHEDNVFPGTSKGSTSQISAIAFSPDGTRIVVGSRNSAIQVWDAQSGIPLTGSFKIGDDSCSINCVAFSPDGTCIAIGTGPPNSMIQTWGAYNGIPLASPFEGHSVPIWSVTFSSDGTHIASGVYDSTACAGDSCADIPLTTARTSHYKFKRVNSVSFSPDGTRLVSGLGDRTIRMCDAHSGTQLTDPFKGHLKAVTSAVFSPDGTRVVSGSLDGTVRVWDVRDATVLAIAGPFEDGSSIIQVMSLLDGMRVVSVSHNCTVRVWDVLNGALRTHEQTMGDRWVYSDSVAISPNGARFAFSPKGSFSRYKSTPSIRVWEEPVDAPPQGPILATWTIDSNGWVMGPASQALLWLPIDLHNVFPQPPTTLVVCPQGSISTCWANLLLGESWSQCYELSC